LEEVFELGDLAFAISKAGLELLEGAFAGVSLLLALAQDSLEILEAAPLGGGDGRLAAAGQGKGGAAVYAFFDAAANLGRGVGVGE
jgi:hypothetical protein